MISKSPRPLGHLIALVGASLLHSSSTLAGQPKEEKPVEPEHNVVLNEEEEVNRLLKKAQKAKEKAKADPQFWPDCVKAYSKVLQKYPNTVYLARWSDGNRKNRAYGLGVYRSTSEKVAEELAKLPPEGLAIYRAVNDPAAHALVVEAGERGDERKMEQVARTFYSTSWGDDALHWLGEIAYDRGANRQTMSRLQRITKHPQMSVPKVAVLARLCLAQIKAGHRSAAQKTLEKLTAATKEPKAIPLRLGHETGDAALASLKKRLEAVKEVSTTQAEPGKRGWETYFGNASHHQSLPTKKTVGVRKWSESIIRLLGGNEDDAKKTQQQQTVRDRWGNVQVRPKSMNTHLVARDRWFFISGQRVLACHSIANPDPRRPQFRYPDQPPQPGTTTSNRYRHRMIGIRQQHHFCTLGGDHVFVTLGPPPAMHWPNNWGGTPPKQQPNWIVARGKRKGGQLGVESGLLLWTLEPGNDPGYRINTKADQEWLKEIYIATSPTYHGGTLYAMAIASSGGSHEAFVMALDAMSGRLLWKTMICSAQPASFSAVLQPAVGLPVAVTGGTVYCVTNLGAVAAVEAATGSIRWIRIYDRDPNIGNQQNRWGGIRSAGTRDYWAANPPIVVEGTLIVTPQDSPKLYAFDTQDGRRLWELDRVSEGGFAPGDAERLKYVLGIANGRLVVSGRDVLFIRIKGGVREAHVSLRDAFEITGRGVVTGDRVMIPTDKAILFVDARLHKKGIPIAKLVGRPYEWEDPEKEAGHLFACGDVLFSVSATHVNAYFDLEEVERKLNARIKADAGDLSAYLELGDIRHRAERYKDAIAAYDQGLKVAAGKGDDPAAKKMMRQMQGQKCETFFSAAEARSAEKDAAGAYAFFSKALDTAEDEEQKVRALWKMAVSAGAQGKASEAVMLYHRMLTEHGATVYEFEPRSSSKASVYAQRRIGEIKKKDPKALEKLESMARAAFDKAAGAKDAKALAKCIADFPNTNAYGEALYALASLNLEKGAFDASRYHFLRFLNGFRGSPKSAEALARLALAYEKAGMIGPAKTALRKLSRMPALEDKQIQLPGKPATQAGAYAKARLAEPVFNAPTTVVKRDLGNGKLIEAWSRPASNSVVPVVPAGQAPQRMLRHVLYLDDGRHLVARSGFNGANLWKTPLSVPAGYTGTQGQCAWSDDVLLVAGKTELQAFETQKGGLAWQYPLKTSSSSGGGAVTSVQAIDRCVVMTQKGGLLTVLDATKGKEVWRVQVPGGRVYGSPALGDGFVAVSGPMQSPKKVIVYELDTGLRRFEIDTDEKPLAVPPTVIGEQVYVVDKGNTLRGYDAVNGKLIWQYALGEQAVALTANHDMVLVVLKNLEIVACDPNAVDEKRRLLWKTIPEESGLFYGVVIDGEDVLLGISRHNKPGTVIAYKATGGKLRWKVPIASGHISRTRISQPVAFHNLSKGHLLTTRASYDPQGRPALAGLVNRGTGKLDWAQDFASDRRFGLFLFDGGVVIGDGRRITGYVSQDPNRAKEEIEALQVKAAGAPADAKLKLQLAQLHFERGEGVKAIETVEEVLKNPKITQEVFAQAFEKLSRFRRKVSRKVKTTIRFTRITAAPKIDGDLSDWQAIQGTKLDSWRNIFLDGEQDRRQPFKKEAWKGAGDLGLTLKGAYDDRRLYLAFEVSDDVHVNRIANGVDLWNGDSVQFAFDLEQDKGMAFLGNDYELGMALNDKGELLLWRWVEKGKYIMKALETKAGETEAKIVRDEAGKKTRYEIALPLPYLSMASKSGLKFGFTCIANDLDAGENVTKGIGPSPGIWNPKFPGQYATGELADTK